MSAADVVQEAIDELYSIDPDEFMERRTALAAQARTTDKAAGKDIAALRKPTRSAYALNLLVRSETYAAQRLADLGEALRTAQESLDGARMRELSTLRRGMVEELADQAFEVTEQRSPPPALRDEVISTLNAAVADEGVVEQLRTGTLLRPARWDGFGFASPPELSVVRPTTPRPPRGEPVSRSKAGAPSAAAGAGRGAATKTRPTKTTKTTRTSRTGRTSRTSAEKRAEEAVSRAEAKAEEQRRRQLLADAQRAVKDADSVLAKASRAEKVQQERVRLLHEQLTDARRRLDEIRIDLRRAENRQGKAQHALERQQK